LRPKLRKKQVLLGAIFELTGESRDELGVREVNAFLAEKGRPLSNTYMFVRTLTKPGFIEIVNDEAKHLSFKLTDAGATEARKLRDGPETGSVGKDRKT
jgi:hypothetical protein